MPKPRRNLIKRVRPVPVNCVFCQKKTVPDYKKPEILTRYMTDRGKIIPRSRSGICAKHQRVIARQIKIARYLALLPYLAQVR